MLFATLRSLRLSRCLASGFFSAARIARLLVERTFAVTILMVSLGKMWLTSAASLTPMKSIRPIPRVASLAICLKRLAASRGLTIRITSSVSRIVSSIALGSLSSLANRRRWLRSARFRNLSDSSRSSATSLTVASI